MNRARHVAVELFGEKVNLSIPLYANQPITLDFLPSRPHQHYSGLREFNHVLIHFGRLFDILHMYTHQQEIPVILPEKKSEVDEIAKDLARTVEKIKNKKKIDPLTARQYHTKLCQLAEIVREITGELKDYHYTFVPLKGGAHVVHAFDVDLKTMIAIDCKRIPLEDGTFAFGMHSPVFDPYDLDRIHKKKLRVVEVCIASGITSIGIILDLFAKGCRPKDATFQVLFASKLGLSVVKRVGDELGINTKFYVGKLYEGLGNVVTSHDSIVDDKGRPVLGDATSILEVATSQKKK